MAEHAYVPINRLPPCDLQCGKPAAGGYLCHFTKGDSALLLCAQCAFLASKRWPGGYMRRKLERIELMVVIVPTPTVFLKGSLAEEDQLTNYVANTEAPNV